MAAGVSRAPNSTFLDFSKIKNRLNFLMWFSKIVHQRGHWGKIWANPKSLGWPKIFDIYWQPLLNKVVCQVSPKTSLEMEKLWVHHVKTAESYAWFRILWNMNKHKYKHKHKKIPGWTYMKLATMHIQEKHFPFSSVCTYPYLACFSSLSICESVVLASTLCAFPKKITMNLPKTYIKPIKYH